MKWVLLLFFKKADYCSLILTTSGYLSVLLSREQMEGRQDIFCVEEMVLNSADIKIHKK